MAGLGTLELALHQAQRLARGEDGLSRLIMVSVVLQHSLLDAAATGTYPAT